MSSLWNERNPIVRWLRVLSIIAFLALVVVVVLDKGRDNFALAALLSGAVLLQLGYEVVVPGLTRGRGKDEHDDD